MPTQWIETEQVPLGCIAPHDRRKEIFSPAPFSGSGAGAETILLTITKKEMLRERAAETYSLAQGVARPEVKEPEVPSGVFAYFCRYWQK